MTQLSFENLGLVEPIEKERVFRSPIIGNVLIELYEDYKLHLSPNNEQWVRKLYEHFIEKHFLSMKQMNVLTDILSNFSISEITASKLFN